MFYYFNIKSLIVDDKMQENPADKNLTHVLVDNELRVIGNKALYEDALKRGERYIRGKRINRVQEYPSFPQSVGIEISSQCNYHCKMCPRRKLERPSVDMDPGLFYKIANEIKGRDIKMLGLYRLGESLMHPKFFEFLDYVGKYDTLKHSFLSTNGGILDDEIVERLLKSNLRFFGISLNARDRVTYKIVTGKDHFDRVSSLVKSIKARKTKRTPFISFQFLEQDVTFDQVPAFVEEYIEYADFVENSVLEDFGGQLTDNSRFLKDRVYAHAGSELFACPRSKFGYAFIYSNGDVVPCICDINAKYIKVGNMNESTLGEIYEGCAWKEFREMHINKTFADHPLCGKCLDRLICGLTGDNENAKDKTYARSK